MQPLRATSAAPRSFSEPLPSFSLITSPLGKRQVTADGGTLGTNADQRQSKVFINEEKEIPKPVDVPKERGVFEGRIIFDESLERVKYADLSNVFHTRSIGSGKYGEVFRGEWKGKQVAIKRLFISTLSDKLQREFCKEVAILKTLRGHERIISLIAATDPTEHPCLVLEYAEGGSLYRALHEASATNLNEHQIARDIAEGLAFLHDAQIWHRDLKSHNVLLDARHEHAKLCDFGMALIKESSATLTLTPRCGSWHWMAPEMMDMEGKYDTSADVYSYGCVLYELAMKRLPWQGAQNEIQLSLAVIQGKRPALPADHKWHSLISSCWAHNPVERPAIMKVFKALSSPTDSWPQTISPASLGGAPTRYGIGVAEEAGAAKLHHVPSDRGGLEATLELARRYEQGIGVAKDATEAVKLYRLASERGKARRRLPYPCNQCQAGLASLPADQPQSATLSSEAFRREQWMNTILVEMYLLRHTVGEGGSVLKALLKAASWQDSSDALMQQILRAAHSTDFRCGCSHIPTHNIAVDGNCSDPWDVVYLWAAPALGRDIVLLSDADALGVLYRCDHPAGQSPTRLPFGKLGQHLESAIILVVRSEPFHVDWAERVWYAPPWGTRPSPVTVRV